MARRDVVDDRNSADVEAEPLEQREIARATAPEAEAVAGRDDLGARGAENVVCELLRSELGHRSVERAHEHVLDARLVE